MLYTNYTVRKVYEVRPYRFKELCSIYDVDPKTLKRWLLPLGIEIPQGYFKIADVEKIISALQLPHVLYDRDDTEYERPFYVRPYLFKDLCKLYNLTPPTLRVWLRPFKRKIGNIHGRYYLIPQIELIIEAIDLPYSLGEDSKKTFRNVGDNQRHLNTNSYPSIAKAI